jgi:hypothetical protein
MSVLMTQLAFLEGMGFDPFFRGLLSVLVSIVVLVGGTYLLIATNTGSRSGFMIAGAGLFGWMFLMGIIWTVYGIGWRGNPPTWALVEINVDDLEDTDDGLLFSEVEFADQLHGIDVSVDDPDPDAAQALALERSQSMDLGEWRYLTPSDSVRGEAQASADTYLLEEGVFDGGDYLPLQFGGFTAGGKPPLDLDEDAGLLSQQWSRVIHFFDETILHPSHPRELMVIQAREIIAKPTFPGQAPPVAEPNPDAPLVSVIMERDRGGPLPSLISGLRFTPFMFTVANGFLFLFLVWWLHIRDRRQDEILAAGAA